MSTVVIAMFVGGITGMVVAVASFQLMVIRQERAEVPRAVRGDLTAVERIAAITGEHSVMTDETDIAESPAPRHRRPGFLTRVNP